MTVQGGRWLGMRVYLHICGIVVPNHCYCVQTIFRRMGFFVLKRTKENEKEYAGCTCLPGILCTWIRRIS